MFKEAAPNTVAVEHRNEEVFRLETLLAAFNILVDTWYNDFRAWSILYRCSATVCSLRGDAGSLFWSIGVVQDHEEEILLNQWEQEELQVQDEESSWH